MTRYLGCCVWVCGMGCGIKGTVGGVVWVGLEAKKDSTGSSGRQKLKFQHLRSEEPPCVEGPSVPSGRVASDPCYGCHLILSNVRVALWKGPCING